MKSIKTYKKWSANEKLIVYEYYKELGAEKLLPLLKNRTKKAIQEMARNLKVAFNQPSWTSKQKDYLQENYEKRGVKQCAKHLKKSLLSVRLQWYRMGKKENSKYENK